MADVVVTMPAGDEIDAILSYLQLHAGQGVADTSRLDFRAVFRRLSRFPENATPRGLRWVGASG